MSGNGRLAPAVMLLGFLVAAPPSVPQVVRQLTDLRSQTFTLSQTSLDDAGARLYFNSSATSFGVTDGRERIVEWQVASEESALPFVFAPLSPPSVSDDGELLAFTSDANLTGENPDRSQEIFLGSTDGATLVQLTDFAGRGAADIREVVLAGSGNRVAFLDGDRILVVEADGTNLRELAPRLDGFVDSLSISDDGTRLVFAHFGDPLGTNPDDLSEVFAILDDGTDLRQVTSSAGSVAASVISGDGSRIAFQRSLAGNSVHVVDWDGSDLTEVGRGVAPTLTDDGRFVFYAGGESGQAQVQRKDLASADPPAALTDEPDKAHSIVVVSGDGSRVAYRTFGESGAFQLMLLTGAGEDEQTLGLHTPYFQAAEPDIASATGRVVFSSNADLTGANPGFVDQLFRIESDGGDLQQVTQPAGLAWHPRITADGEELIFMSYSDLAGVDPSAFQKTFRIAADGSGLLQISGVGDLGEHADVADDGGRVVLQGLGGLQQATLDGGGPATFLPSFWNSNRTYPRVDAAGEWVVFHTNADFQVYRASTDGAVLEQITTGDGTFPVLSGDGARIAFASSDDPLGTNPDGNTEIFVYEPATATFRQLTEAATGTSGPTAISADGEWVYFISSIGWTEPDALDEGEVDVFRVRATGGVIERVGGLGGGGGFAGGGLRRPATLEVDATGSRAVVTISADWTGGNPDTNLEVFLVDFTTQPSIHVGQTSPTTVRWDVEAGPLTYDVIRGDVASLAGSVDLGPVVCLEKASADNTTIGFEDVVEPSPGQAFFFLYRGSQGSLRGPGSWGRGTAGERAPGVGACD